MSRIEAKSDRREGQRRRGFQGPTLQQGSAKSELHLRPQGRLQVGAGHELKDWIFLLHRWGKPSGATGLKVREDSGQAEPGRVVLSSHTRAQLSAGRDLMLQRRRPEAPLSRCK